MNSLLSKITKLNRIGLMLIILSILTILLMVSATGLIGVACMSDWQSFLQLEILLPDGVEPTTTVAELQEMDRAYLEGQYVEVITYLSLVTAAQLVICAMLIRIGLSWRRKEAFGESVIQSLFVVGVISLLHGLYFMISGWFITPSLGGEVLFLSYLRDIIVTGAESGMVGSLTTGLLFIALSKVLKQGQVLKSEQELTV